MFQVSLFRVSSQQAPRLADDLDIVSLGSMSYLRCVQASTILGEAATTGRHIKIGGN